MSGKRSGAYRAFEERFGVYAPIVGGGTVSAGGGAALRIRASRLTVIGDGDEIDVGYQYRFAAVPVAEDVSRAIFDAFRTWASGRRGREQPVRPGEYRDYRRFLRARLLKVPPGSRPSFFRTTLGRPGEIDIGAAGGVAIGDYTWVSRTERATVYGATVDLVSLMLSDDRLVEEVHAGLRRPSGAGRAVRRAINGATGRLSPAELAARTSAPNDLRVDGWPPTGRRNVAPTADRDATQPVARIGEAHRRALLRAVAHAAVEVERGVARDLVLHRALWQARAEHRLAARTDEVLAAVARDIGLPEDTFAAGRDGCVPGWDNEQIDRLRDAVREERRAVLGRVIGEYDGPRRRRIAP